MTINNEYKVELMYIYVRTLFTTHLCVLTVGSENCEFEFCYYGKGIIFQQRIFGRSLTPVYGPFKEHDHYDSLCDLRDNDFFLRLYHLSFKLFCSLYYSGIFKASSKTTKQRQQKF